MAPKEGFTAEEVTQMLQTTFKANSESLKEFAKELAFAINHPEPTEEEKAKMKQDMEARVEMARIHEEGKRMKRLRCPHKRIGGQWGMFNGTSVIAWHYTQLSARDANGMPTEGPNVALGVCQWCQSEFKPGDPDYAEKLSWGTNPVAAVVPMHKSLGIWL